MVACSSVGGAGPVRRRVRCCGRDAFDASERRRSGSSSTTGCSAPRAAARNALPCLLRGDRTGRLHRGGLERGEGRWPADLHARAFGVGASGGRGMVPGHGCQGTCPQTPSHVRTARPPHEHVDDSTPRAYISRAIGGCHAPARESPGTALCGRARADARRRSRGAASLGGGSRQRLLPDPRRETASSGTCSACLASTTATAWASGARRRRSSGHGLFATRLVWSPFLERHVPEPE